MVTAGDRRGRPQIADSIGMAPDASSGNPDPGNRARDPLHRELVRDDRLQRELLDRGKLLASCGRRSRLRSDVV
jgi:hypothetical protein